MSEPVKISGVWQGEITYGEEFPAEMQNKKKKFRMELEESNGEFTGKYYETEGFGIIRDEASVNGFIEDGMISFVKMYKAFYLVNDKGEVITVPDRDPPEINYAGDFNEEAQLYEGDWSVVVEFKQLTFGYSESALTGTWKMEREK